MLSTFLLMLFLTASTPEQTTWVWPEAHTYPEERQVADKYPIIPVEQTIINQFTICKFCKFKFTKNLHRLQRMTRNLQDFVYYLQ